MNYAIGAAALIGLCLSGILLLAALSWLVKHAHARLTVAWLVALASLVVLQSLEFLYHAADLFVTWPVFLKLVDPLIVLLPFCLYGYIRALQGDNLLTSCRATLAHLSPALITALLDVPYWSLPADERIQWILRVRDDENLWQPLAPYGNEYLAIIAVLSLFYWWRQRQLGYAGRKARTGEWIGQLQGLQLIMALSLLVRITLSKGFGIDLSVAYALAPVSGYLLYLILAQTQLPLPAARALPALNSDGTRPVAMHLTPETGAAESASGLPAAGTAQENSQWLLFRELEDALQAGAFRDNELSLGKLATQCGMTSHQASAAINQCSGGHFYDWVNQYRIDAACEALRHSDTPVARICFEVGFNSKSTFNTAFRRRTGLTPTAFRSQGV
ncbi:helix-turn-helix domain-containing protein [Thalassolituus sp. LLYu03]|uniref:helix-turn-helix domain-containing protein n=1 Tax=Thalassolituus sp. LLYu03 TaxID=3421656 RepID=UPI003D27422D